MKTAARSFAAGILALLARAILHKYKPQVVMVTGSVGKTSTKDATAAALSGRFYLRASEKSYNSEFGVPLTIIGAKNPWSDAVGWSAVIGEALALVLFPNHYPKLLVLEVGADRPGDLARILEIGIPDAVIVTRLPDVPVHVESYATPAAVREEEFTPAYGLRKGSPLIVSADDGYAKDLAGRLSARTTTYGFDASADIRLSDPEVVYGEDEVIGMRSRVHVAGTPYDLMVRGALGRQQLYAPAAALACALALGLPPEEALAGLQAYVPPPGRSRILKGKNHSTLIDDTYNASPAAVEEILASLDLVKAKRRIVILGDMLELGRFSVAEHERIGKLAAEHADMVVGVGARSVKITEAARAGGKSERDALHFLSSESAAEALADVPRPGDVILIKASQGIRAERITKALLADSRDEEQLVRQDPQWLKKV